MVSVTDDRGITILFNMEGLEILFWGRHWFFKGESWCHIVENQEQSIAKVKEVEIKMRKASVAGENSLM